MKKIVLFLFVLLWAVPLYAVQILATVQDEIITDVDVDERSSLVSELFNVSPNEILKKQILDDLVNEKIKVLTAKKQGIDLSDTEIGDGISFLERQNQMPLGSLEKMIHQKGLSLDSLKSQIIADLMWLRYIQSLNLERPKVSDKQVTREIKKIREKLMETRYLLAEIYIPFADNETAAEQQINTLFNRIVAGESFTDLAKQYSKGKTAHLMGDLGWVNPGELEKAVDVVLSEIQIGQLSKPIKGKKGFYLILMRDNQPALDSEMQEFVQITQLIIDEKDYLKLKESIEKSASSCMTFTQFAMQNGVKGSNSGALPEMMTKRMSQEFKLLLKDKELGELIGPVNMPPYLLFAMTCASTVKSVLPNKDVVKEKIMAEEFEKKLADLLEKERKKMIVEIK